MTTPIWYYVVGAVLVALVLSVPFLLWFFRWRSNVKEEQEGQYWLNQNRWLLNAFDNYDISVYGFRGSGKDVIFAHAINLKGGKHYSNIAYNSQTEVRDLADLHVGGNTYEDFINGTFTQFEPNFEEGFHFFISDAGIYLGCQYNKELNQDYGEIPIHIALRRHLYNSHVHTNSQALSRPWDKIREQQGCFIHCLGTTNYGDFLVVNTITYTKYDSALACLPPPENPDKYHVLKYGEIQERKFKIPKLSLTYDSRYFRTVLLKQQQSEVIEENGKRARIVFKTSRKKVSKKTSQMAE